MMAKEYKKKVNSPKQMMDSFMAFWEECNSKTVVRTEFCQRSGEFVSATIPAPVTVTKKAFAAYLGMTENNFYETYGKSKKFGSVIARITELCEIDAREKFENGTINSRLAGLWMSNYGYSTKTESKEEIKNSVVIVDDLDG